MGKRFKKILKWTFFLLIVAMVALFVFSPFKKHEGAFRTIESTIRINAPVEQVFAFMGNSDNASKWSVYVDHITTLNPDEIQDGKIGSLRRCYCFPDETERRWDEEIIDVIENQKRVLSIFNLNKFPMTAYGLLTEQVYKKIDERTTELSLTLFYANDEPSFSEMLKTKFGAYEIQRIFKGNLENIKKIIESKND